MHEGFDPYHKWLGIPPAQQPPNHYRLLGVDLFESDLDVIANAADRQMGHVRALSGGPNATASQRILNELAAARLCLLDPRAKADYDAQLAQARRQRTASVALAVPIPLRPGAPSAAARPAQWIASPPAEASEFDVSSPGPAPRLRRTSSARGFFWLKLAGHLTASVIGLALGYVVLCWFGPQYDFLGLLPAREDGTANSQSIEDSNSPPAGQPSSATAEKSASVTLSPTPSPTPSASAPARPPSPPPNLAGQATRPKPATDPVPQPAPAPTQPSPPQPQPAADALVDFPARIDLPPSDSAASVELAAIRLPQDKQLALDLTSTALADDDPRRFVLRPETGAPGAPGPAVPVQRWSVLLAALSPSSPGSASLQESVDSSPLAEFWLESGRLWFRWKLAAGLPLGLLRNCLLLVSVAGEQRIVPLRSPQVVPPLLVDLDEKVVVARLAVHDWPDADTLRFEITRLDPFPVSFEWQPQPYAFGKRATVALVAVPGAELRLVARKSASAATVHLSAFTGSKGGAPQEFTSKQVNFKKTSLDKQLAEARTELAQRQAYAQELPGQLQSAMSMSVSSDPVRGAQERQRKAQAIGNLKREIRKNDRIIASLGERIPKIAASVAVLVPLTDLGNALHEKAAIHFRIFAEVDGLPVELAVTGSPP